MNFESKNPIPLSEEERKKMVDRLQSDAKLLRSSETEYAEQEGMDDRLEVGKEQIKDAKKEMQQDFQKERVIKDASVATNFLGEKAEYDENGVLKYPQAAKDSIGLDMEKDLIEKYYFDVIDETVNDIRISAFDSHFNSELLYQMMISKENYSPSSLEERNEENETQQIRLGENPKTTREVFNYAVNLARRGKNIPQIAEEVKKLTEKLEDEGKWKLFDKRDSQ